MTEETASEMTDPAEQLKSIQKLLKFSTDKLSGLGASIQRFVAKFDEQKANLSRLYQKTQDHQRVAQNISDVRERLTTILDLLKTSERLHPIVHSDIGKNFDAYVNCMQEIGVALSVLSRQSFNDAREECEKLKEIREEGKEKVLTYFETLIKEGADCFQESWFAFENGKFVVTNEELRQNVCYPIPAENFERLAKLEAVLSAMCVKSQQEYYVKSRSKFIMDSLQGLFSRAEKRQIRQPPGDVLDIPNYQKQSHPIHRLAFVLEFMVNREDEISQKVFGPKAGAIFYETIQTPFNMFVQKVEKLRVPTLNSHVDVLFDLDLVSTLREIMLSFDRPDLSFGDMSGRPKIREMISPFYETIRNSLDSFVELVEKHDLAFVPQGGGVSPLTSNVILFLTDLCSYSTILVDTVAGKSFENLVMDTLKNLLENLKGKSKHYPNDVVLQHLFLLTNAYYAYTAIQNSALSKFVSPEIMMAIEDMNQKAQEQYMANTWGTAFAKLHLSKKEQDEFGTISRSGGLNGKQRKVIKQQFKAFSSRVDEIQAKTKSYRIKNMKMMASIQNDAVKLVSTEYEKFWTRWKDSGFSKTPEKWICYQPSTLISIINKLYGENPKK